VKKAVVMAAIGIIAFSNSAQAEMSFKDFSYGWTALTQQDDPFDDSKIKILQISKGFFTITCEKLIMKTEKAHFDGISFYSNLKYRVDDQKAVDKEGRYSTSPYGSDSVSDSRYYLFYTENEDIKSFKKGKTIKVAGKYSNSGWESRDLNLSGFSETYNEMCGK
jgi:hypothetical protein